MTPKLDGDDTVEIPVDLAEKILRLAYYFGEPQFIAFLGDGESVEHGQTAVLDAELQLVARYPSTDIGMARRLADLLNAITVEVADILPGEVRTRAARLADRERHG